MTPLGDNPRFDQALCQLEAAHKGKLTDIDNCLELLQAFKGHSPTEAAFAQLLRSALQIRAALFGENSRHPPTNGPISVPSELAGHSVYQNALGESALLSLIQFEGMALRDSAKGDPTPHLAHALNAWQQVALEAEPDDATWRAWEASALAAEQARPVIELCAARALAAEAKGDAELALGHARRCSRMARTEGLPAQELLAHLILARCRRGARCPHLAIRVLAALSEFAPASFQPWLGWELFFAGAPTAEIQELVPLAARGETRAATAYRLLLELANAAERGSFESFRASAGLLREQVAFFGPAKRDVEALLTALSADASLPSAPTLAAWCSGDSDIAPPAIHGLCVRAEEEELGSEAYALVSPGQPPRRILGLGAALVKGSNRLRRTRRKQGRVETMTAVLALAGGEGISIPDAFLPTYSFPYVDEVHRGVLDVLLGRVRAYTEGTATLERSEGRLRLLPDQPLLVPDPRAAPQAYDRVLRLLARQGKAKAAETARASGLSVRATQNALKELIDAGLCSTQKEGRQVIYTVEDTTFSEPTQLLRRNK